MSDANGAMRQLRALPAHQKRAWHKNGVDLRPGIIYALRCPKTNRIRYVGKTGKRLIVRFRAHLADAKKNKMRPVCNWIRKLNREGLKPVPEVLQECLPGMMNASEQEWIAQFRDDGVKLLNATDGGEATAWSEEAKIRQSARCAEINRRLAEDPKWLEAQYRRRAANKGLTLEEYREWREQREAVVGWGRLERKYRSLVVRVKGNWKKRHRKGRVRGGRSVVHEGGAVLVPLTKGMVAIIDAEDADRVGRYQWSAVPHGGRYRAKTNLPGKKPILLNRFIAQAAANEMVCFNDGDMLNCRKSNLCVIRQKGGKPIEASRYESRIGLYRRVA